MLLWTWEQGCPEASLPAAEELSVAEVVVMLVLGFFPALSMLEMGLTVAEVEGALAPDSSSA